jgi:hypothetical protein
MNSGRIVVDRASRRFRVYPKAQRTLKDAFVSFGRSPARDVWALKDVSSRSTREPPSGSSAATARARRRCCV